MDREVIIVITQKDTGISLETANKAQEEVFQLILTKLLHTYMNFIMDNSDLFLMFLMGIVICKNNSIHVPLNPSFDILILSIRNYRLGEFL